MTRQLIDADEALSAKHEAHVDRRGTEEKVDARRGDPHPQDQGVRQPAVVDVFRDGRSGEKRGIDRPVRGEAGGVAGGVVRLDGMARDPPAGELTTLAPSGVPPHSDHAWFPPRVLPPTGAMVSNAPTRPAVAAGESRRADAPGSVPGAGQRSHAAADAGGDRHPVLPPVCGTLPDGARPGRRAGAGGAAALAGAGVLLPGAQPAEGGEGDRRAVRRNGAQKRGAAAGAAGDRPVHGRGDQLDRVRATGADPGRERGPRALPAGLRARRIRPAPRCARCCGRGRRRSCRARG